MIALSRDRMNAIPREGYPAGFTPEDLAAARKKGLMGWADMGQPVRISEMDLPPHVREWIAAMRAT